MAWNEPGGNSNKNDQDPWGKPRSGKDKNKDRQGPPDLDEAFRKLQDNVTSIFGKKKSGGNGGGGGRKGPGSSKTVFLLGGLLLVGFWLTQAVYSVDEQEQAVILRLGKYHETVGAGLHIYFPPIDRKYQTNVTRERAYSKQGQMLTEDENIIEVPLTVQYKISNLEDFVLRVDQPEISLQHATDSALRHVVGSTAMDQVLTEGREVLAEETKVRLQRFLDQYQTGITVTQVNVQNAQAPREVQEAFDDVIRAREDEQREKNQAETYANGVVPEARGQAQRILEDANGYRDEVIARAEGEAQRFNQLVAEYRKAPEVTRQRLYIETMQDVLGNTSKVLMSGDQGKNSLLYLPLDKMLQEQKAAPRDSYSSESAPRTSSSSVRTPVEVPSSTINTRVRERR
ncbi:FtsH protease activity modulator HflK [Thiopseudomonas alkaliphila]|uniref:FtsH protease activity modulator HflK n=1 Tax=Thiopseudomonas alkaliphila TaxID=1697053 RepID=UPI002578A6BF|nr:FtsH protease activity modulator HflK [Thiopseudomonas alkaliphila]MDM1707361.1 FtsH protease activity modulator HflK [Thiopseudomonas alkaliphila]